MEHHSQVFYRSKKKEQDPFNCECCFDPDLSCTDAAGADVGISSVEPYKMQFCPEDSTWIKHHDDSLSQRTAQLQLSDSSLLPSFFSLS